MERPFGERLVDFAPDHSEADLSSAVAICRWE